MSTLLWYTCPKCDYPNLNYKPTSNVNEREEWKSKNTKNTKQNKLQGGEKEDEDNNLEDND